MMELLDWRQRTREAVGWYNALIVNRRLSQCMVNVIILSWDNSIMHCLSARPSELSRSSLPHVALYAVRTAAQRTASQVTLQSAQSTCMQLLNFGRFSSLSVRGSTYMWITLYVGIYGMSLCFCLSVSVSVCPYVWLALWCSVTVLSQGSLICECVMFYVYSVMLVLGVCWDTVRCFIKLWGQTHYPLWHW